MSLLITGRVLVTAQSLDEHKERRKIKKLLQQGDAASVAVNYGVTGVTKTTDAVGASRREKNRLTMIMRQKLRGYWDEDLTTPKGSIADSVLLVSASKHARLEDMSFHEPSTWLRDHQFVLDGVSIVRKKGQKVGTLGHSWREARYANPALFYSSRIGKPEDWKPSVIRVWFQPKMTEDAIIACWLSDLIVEETRHIFMEAFLNVGRASTQLFM